MEIYVSSLFSRFSLQQFMPIVLSFFLLMVNNLSGEDDIDLSTIEVMLSADCEPLATVGGCVNVYSGDFFQVEDDLIGNTIDPLHITRFYDSSSRFESFLGFGFGSQFPFMISDDQKGTRHHYTMISERDGFLVPYRNSIYDTVTNYNKIFMIDPRVLEKGYTNLNRSAGANFVNRVAISNSHNKKGRWIVDLGDGTKRYYDLETQLGTKNRHRIHFPTKNAHLLTKEIKPNGNIVKFEYIFKDGRPYPSKIYTLNRKKETINEINFTCTSSKCIVTSSCEQSVTYSLNELRQKYFGRSFYPGEKSLLKKVSSSNKNPTTYETPLDEHQAPFVSKIDKTNGRTLQINYTKEYQVEKIKAHAGPDNEKVNIFTFDYGKETTKVWDALDQLTVYSFDSNHRLINIDYRDGKQSRRHENFEWHQREGREGWLKSKSIGLGDELYQLKAYRYDERGNVERETIHGNITGEKGLIFKNKEKTDSHSIDFEYSKKRNLLIRKETPEGIRIDYSYLPDTNLCVAELHSYLGKIQQRIFKAYDDNGELSSLIEDDGSSQNSDELTDVSYRKMKLVLSVMTQGASYGKPKEIQFLYLDHQSGKMVLQRREEIFYFSNGLEEHRRIYDSKNSFCFEIRKEYDNRQRLSLETDALGYITTYKYDDHNNKTEVKQDSKILGFTYDRVNRLKTKTEKYDEKPLLTTAYSYNALNQLIEETDPYGNTTTYSYDRLGCQTRCTKPSLPDKKAPVVKKTYNMLDQMIEHTDENGNITKYSYNIYGKPIEITHPDGAVEKFSYYSSGLLKQQWLPNQTSILYTYNPTGKVTKETTLNPQGKTLREEEYSYKGSLLTQKKDPLGQLTLYEYDGSGRKISETFGDKVIKYDYDDFDNVSKITRFINDIEGQVDFYQYDWLNQLTAKTQLDLQGLVYAKETYQYDRFGHLIEKNTHQNNTSVATWIATYHSDGIPKSQQNPFGHQTTRIDDLAYINAKGQKVLKRVMADPMGRISHEIDNISHQLEFKYVYEQGKEYSATHFKYDLKGNLINETATVKVNGEKTRDYSVSWTYDSRDRVILESETGKATQYEYDPNGKWMKKTKPDQVVLQYDYDQLGRLEKLHSSDGTISYQYEYDLNDHPIFIKDLVHGIELKRTYHHDRLMREEFSSDMILEYSYDPLDRFETIKFSDSSYIKYVYDSFHLVKAQRFNAQNRLQYDYECQDYDLHGNLLRGQSPAGTTQFQYNLINKPTQIQTHHWTSNLQEFDKLGNLLKMKQTDPSGLINCEFTYDRFNHLNSESTVTPNQFVYDSLGNCVKKNEKSCLINELNQVEHDGKSQFFYDDNGNLISQTNPDVIYQYDALNRLISIKKAEGKTQFLNDPFGRCIKIADNHGERQLLYHGKMEIGSQINGKIDELRLMHPYQEHTFVIELQDKVYFPIQDFRHNICALQNEDGSLAQWSRFSTFGQEIVDGPDKAINNPWRFANRRKVAGLSMFTHRFYHPELIRWLNPDPIGFADSLNLYTYARNNPMCYFDPDGRLVFIIPLVYGAFTAGEIIIVFTTADIVATSLAAAAVSYVCYQADTAMDRDHRQHMREKDERRQKEWQEKYNKDNAEEENENIGTKLKPRTEPKSLEEQLALEEAKGGAGKEIMHGDIRDPKYPDDIWQKKGHTHKNPEGQKTSPDIHYWENLQNGYREGFKFKK